MGNISDSDFGKILTKLLILWQLKIKPYLFVYATPKYLFENLSDALLMYLSTHVFRIRDILGSLNGGQAGSAPAAIPYYMLA